MRVNNAYHQVTIQMMSMKEEDTLWPVLWPPQIAPAFVSLQRGQRYTMHAYGQ